MTQNRKVHILIKDVWRVICCHGDNIPTRIMFSLVDSLRLQSLSQFGAINLKDMHDFQFCYNTMSNIVMSSLKLHKA